MAHSIAKVVVGPLNPSTDLGEPGPQPFFEGIEPVAPGNEVL